MFPNFPFIGSPPPSSRPKPEVWTYDAVRDIWTDCEGSTLTDAERKELCNSGTYVPGHSTLRQLRSWSKTAQRVGILAADPRGTRRKYPGECPCGVQAQPLGLYEGCPYHRDA